MNLFPLLDQLAWNRPRIARWLAGAALLVGSRMAAGAVEPAPVPFHVVCSVDRPVTSDGQPVAVMVFTDAPKPQSLRYRWTASAGGFSRQGDGNSKPAAAFEGAKAEWWPQILATKTNAEDEDQQLAPGRYTISAVVTGPGNGQAGDNQSCSVVVVVRADADVNKTLPPRHHSAPPRPTSAPSPAAPSPVPAAPARAPAAPAPGRSPASVDSTISDQAASPNGYQTWRSLLVKGQAQSRGYGLYSYMLFGAPPDAGSREAFLVFIDSYLNLIADVRGLESSTPLSALNITYLPVNSEPPPTISSPTCPGHSAMACWVLEHYDYGEARELLASVPGARGRGPFIVSTLKMLDGSGAAVRPNLFEDLSGKPSSVVEFWVNQFLVQTTQQKFWQPTTLRALALNLRTAIAYAAEGFPMVQKAVPASLVFTDSK